jgi:hypothetical protein
MKSLRSKIENVARIPLKKLSLLRRPTMIFVAGVYHIEPDELPIEDSNYRTINWDILDSISFRIRENEKFKK